MKFTISHPDRSPGYHSASYIQLLGCIFYDSLSISVLFHVMHVNLIPPAFYFTEILLISNPPMQHCYVKHGWYLLSHALNSLFL